MEDTIKPLAELFVATGCNHCPIVLNELSELLKKGEISNLNVTNIAVNNERANKLNIRSVPWFSLSNKNSFMIFAGEHSAKEINHWVTLSQSESGMKEYFEEFLTNGQLMTITQAIQFQPKIFASVIAMLKDDETSMNVRIGLDALLENFSGTTLLQQYSSELKNIANMDNIRLQIDALHYIALTADPKNKTFLSEKTQHKDKQIKDAAIDALETLNNLTR